MIRSRAVADAAAGLVMVLDRLDFRVLLVAPIFLPEPPALLQVLLLSPVRAHRKR
jgi:hypothetical protein